MTLLAPLPRPGNQQYVSLASPDTTFRIIGEKICWHGRKHSTALLGRRFRSIEEPSYPFEIIDYGEWSVRGKGFLANWESDGIEFMLEDPDGFDILAECEMLSL